MCETLFLAQKKEYSLGMSENGMLKGAFGPNSESQIGENCLKRYLILLGCSNERDMLRDWGEI